MSDHLQNWLDDGKEFGWEMPSAVWWKRLPVIRNVRAAYYGVQVERHGIFYGSMGAIVTGYDKWVIYGMAKGFERNE